MKLMTITIIQGLWKEGSKKNKNCESACGHVVHWNFRLRFEPLGPPPLTSGINEFLQGTYGNVEG